MSYRQNVLLTLSIIGAAVAGIGCGDSLNPCPETVLIVISNPTSGATIDDSSDTSTEPGLQVDVSVRTQGISAGQELTLIVTPSGGSDAVFPAPAVVTTDGSALFEGVTLPSGALSVRVETVTCKTDDDPGMAVSDAIDLVVVGEITCGLAVREGTVTSEFYAPLPVLNSTLDTDLDTAGFQGNVDVATAPGFVVTLYKLDVIGGAETVVGTASATGTGDAAFELTLSEGTHALRATCESPNGGGNSQSATSTMFVDVTPPTCQLVGPLGPVIPEHDEDPDTDGTQVTLQGTVSGDSDTFGETATFGIGAADIAGSTVGADGNTSATGTFSAPATATVSIDSQDHAANPCTDSVSVVYETDGCGITHVAPADAVTTDSSAGTTGVQAAITVQVSDECVDQTATTTCGTGDDLSMTVPAGGLTTFADVTLCNNSPCERNFDCETRVTSTAGITTSAPVSIIVDNLAPTLDIQFNGAVGAVECDASVDESADSDAVTAGTQLDIRVFSPVAAVRELDQDSTPVTLNASLGTAVVTLAAGPNVFDARVRDSYGNESTQTCTINLATLPVNFSAPVASNATLGGTHGTASGGNLVLDICGTVGDPTATVTLSIDGTPQGSVAATAGGTWCFPDSSLSEGTGHELEAVATAGVESGSATVVNLAVDITAPATPTSPVAVGLDRQEAEFRFTAPSEGGNAAASYAIKFGTEPFTNGNFDSTGTTIAAPTPAAPGTPQTARRSSLKAGTDYYFALAALDAYGNRSAIAATTTPLNLSMTSGGTIVGQTAETYQAFGFRTAAGDLNDDTYDDLIVGAGWDGPPFASGRVYVFLGGPDGISATPDFTITTAIQRAYLGVSITTLDWDGNGVTDFAVSANGANGGAGQVFIFLGGDAFTVGVGTPSKTVNNADITIDSTGEGYLASGLLGSSITRVRFNDDDRDDLLIGAQGASSGRGLAIVLMGGTSSASSIIFDDDTTAGMNGALAWRIPFTEAASGCFLGGFVYNLGALDGAGGRNEAIGIGGFTDQASCTGDDIVYVMASRAGVPGSPFATLAFDETVDVRLKQTTTIDNSKLFGSSMGSIANPAGGRDIVVGAATLANGHVYIVPGAITEAGSGALDIETVATTDLASNTAERLSSVANNALSPNPDINNDGYEDLVVAQTGSPAAIKIWYGPNFPVGTTTVLANPPGYESPNASFDQAYEVIWAGDLNNDGLQDICWSDPELYENPVVGKIETLM